MKKTIERKVIINKITEALHLTDGNVVARIYNQLRTGDPRITYHYASVEHNDDTFTEERR